jgi:hypothetical protein
MMAVAAFFEAPRRASWNAAGVRTYLGVLLAAMTCGCGATTLRVSAGPTLDTGARVGGEVMLSAGIGMPLDFNGRSHHFAQARASLGGGLDGRTQREMLTVGGELDYIHWAEPRADVRVGLHMLYRKLPDAVQDPKLYAFGAHFAVLPIVLGSDGGIGVQHFVLGPEIRVEHVWTDSVRGHRALFSLPLVAELDLFITGD